MSAREKDKYDHRMFNGPVDGRENDCGSETIKKKLPLRVQNDWSEHISSKGLIYYYNCRTEVSQWQKPEEWTLSSMPQEDIKKLINTKFRNNENNKRNLTSTVQNISTSPKRVKYTQPIQIDKQINFTNNQVSVKNPKGNDQSQQVKNSKSINSLSNTFSGINNKCKNNEANFNNDDMDISPGSSPLSKCSHSSEFDSNKKSNYFEFETPAYRNQSSTVKLQKYNKYSTNELKVENCSPANHDHHPVTPNSVKTTLNSSSVSKTSNFTYNTNKYSENSTVNNSTNLSQLQISLATSLRSILNILQPSRLQFSSKDDVSHSKFNSCLSVYHISDLLLRLEAVNNSGETASSYRSHRLQAQLSQNNNTNSFSSSNNNNNNNNDSKAAGKPSVTVNQIKELVKFLQDFIQENYPNSLSSITPVSPTYSKSNRVTHYTQILANLIETCLLQLCPQSFNSPSSTSSPGSLKDNNSSASTSGNSQSYIDTLSKQDVESPTKKETEKPKSVLQETDMVKYVSFDITNSYRNQLADIYVQEAQLEYYKFVRLHSVLYAELACESKKLKALVRISEINTELLKQKKDDLEKLVQMLDSRRLPNHLKCDYVPNI